MSDEKKCWALSTTMEKHEADATIRRNILGYRFAKSKAEAIGAFVEESLRLNAGFRLGEVLTIEIPLEDGN